MEFSIVDILTGKTPTKKVLEEAGCFLKQNEDPSDNYLIKEDGTIIFRDDNGDELTLDKKRFAVICNDQRYPDFNYFEYILYNYLCSIHPEYKNKMFNFSTSVNMFAQIWPDTSGAFRKIGCIAGCTLTQQYTTIMTASCILYDSKIMQMQGTTAYGVFFEKQLGYVIENPTEKFFADVKNHNLKGVYDSIDDYSKK